MNAVYLGDKNPELKTSVSFTDKSYGKFKDTLNNIDKQNSNN